MTMHIPTRTLERGVDRTVGEVSAVVVVPTFNHESRIAGVLDGLRLLGMTIIVVDDGSTDGTQESLARWIQSTTKSRVEIRRHEINRGKAAALRTGFDLANDLGATHVVTIDADGQLDPTDVPALLEVARTHPRALVLGERPANMPGCPARCAAGRRSTSLAVHAQCGIRITDSQCGLRVYPLELVQSVRCFASRYSFETEIITRAVWAGFDVIPVPVRCQYFGPEDRVSHYRPWIDTLRQAGVHARLLLRAAIPLPHHRVVEKSAAPAQSGLTLWRRFVQWINPMRSLREARSAELGRLEFAASLAIGVWIGTTPFFGFHILLCMYFAWRLHLHPAPMILGSQVSVPPVGVLLAIVSTSIGHFLLTGQLLPADHVIPSWNTWPSFAWRWFSAWLLGSALLGFLIAAATFWIAIVLGSLRAPSGVVEPVATSTDQCI